MRMLSRIEGLSANDRVLEDELLKCLDAGRCWQIAQEAENQELKMEANAKSMRLYRAEEYQAGML